MPIARASAADAEMMARIHAAAFPPWEAWGRDTFVLQLALPGALGLIDHAGGMILLRHAADEAEILTLAVAPARRRQGIARRLLHYAIRTLRGLDIAALFLEVSVANSSARALYESVGFEPVGTRPRYYADGADAVLMRLRLPQVPPPPPPQVPAAG